MSPRLFPCMRLPLVFFALAIIAMPQVFDLRRPNTAQIEALDRKRTVVLLTLGILEEHGPYMPAYTDGFAAERHARELADALAEDPGWNVVMFPPIPLGSNAANEIGERHRYTGSYTVRPATLRAVLMDLAGELGAGGFRWVFVIYPHGGGGARPAAAGRSTTPAIFSTTPTAARWSTCLSYVRAARNRRGAVRRQGGFSANKDSVRTLAAARSVARSTCTLISSPLPFGRRRTLPSKIGKMRTGSPDSNLGEAISAAPHGFGLDRRRAVPAEERTAVCSSA